jgi:predicted metal-dependent enzyme (double-stranded beta helix superfamily)
MTPSEQTIPREILEFCERCAEGLRGLKNPRDCIAYIQKELPLLLRERDLFIGLLQDAVGGLSFLDPRRPTMFDNELVVYVAQDRLFSLRMYLWGPGEFSAPHDHNAWGVLGPLSDGYSVTNYRREDDESREGYARLTEVEHFTLNQGETTSTLPLKAGIHKTGNPTEETLISLNLYGKSLPRGYINGFDLEGNRVFPILPPRRKKEYLLSRALETLKKDAAGPGN